MGSDMMVWKDGEESLRGKKGHQCWRMEFRRGKVCVTQEAGPGLIYKQLQGFKQRLFAM